MPFEKTKEKAQREKYLNRWLGLGFGSKAIESAEEQGSYRRKR